MLNEIVRRWYLSLLAGNYKKRGDEKMILDNLKISHKGAEVVLLETKADFGFVVITPDRVEVAFRGTHGWRGWLSNLRFFPNKFGFHRGFYAGWIKMWPLLVPILKRNPGKIVEVGGHSRGCPFAQLFSLFCLCDLGIRTRPIVFCPPRLCNLTGVDKFIELELDCINIISPNDVVDNVGAEVTHGKFYGKVIQLPRSQERNFIERLLDHVPGWGHAPSEVTDGLIQYFIDRDKSTEVTQLKLYRYFANI